MRHSTSVNFKWVMMFIVLLFYQTSSGLAQTVTFHTRVGDIDVQLLPNAAPVTVANFLRYVDGGLYTNSFVHRSAPSFVIQGGGFYFDGTYTTTVPAFPPIGNEFNVSNTRGTLAMAKISGVPNSATSQWFFNVVDNSAVLDTLDGGQTVFGRVKNARSLAAMDAIAAVPIFDFGSPFDQLPLLNYSGSGGVQTQNMVTVFSVSRVNTSFSTDFDGDGKSDISIYRPTDGNWWVSRSSGGTSVQKWGVSTDKAVPADYDADGKTDLAIFRNDTWWIFQSGNGQSRVVQFGAAGDIPVPGDHDGDGKADLCIFRPSTGTWWRQLSSTGQVFATQFGSSGDVPLIGDYDGDGKTDLAIYRAGASSTWYVLRSSDSVAKADAFGRTGDVPLSGDFNGDNKSDLAVFRPSTGTWFVARTTGVPAQNFDATSFGAAADTPVPGDYDGDGATDLAVYRSGSWYVLRSSTGGVTIVQFGIATDKPVPAAFEP